jgi:hypothetical protein
MTSSDSPIFIIGTERSGSNLLRLILNQHPSIAIPHPPHILKDMMPLEPRYGDLSRDENFRALVRDVVRLVELHFSPWDVRVDAREAFETAPSRDVYGVKAALYDQYRRAKGKTRWGCKSTFVIRYVDRVLAVHPRAKLIHLVRDGRDVAVSARDSVFNHFHPYYVARLWAGQQREGAALAERLAPERLLTVRYEDLLEDPAAATRRVCAFLGEDYSDSLLDYSGGEEAKRLAAQSRSWQNVARPVIKGNRAKYKTALSPEQIRVFEREAYDELVRFGYAPENERGALRAPSQTQRLAFWLSETAQTARETLKSFVLDENGWSLARKKLYVLSLRLRPGRCQRRSDLSARRESRASP